MSRTNKHLIIRNNREDFYFFHDDIIHAGDIVNIGGYRVVILSSDYFSGYTELTANLVNDGEITIERKNLR